MGPGSSFAVAITTTPQNGFAGTVALSVSGLPAGVTGTFSAASLNLVAASSAAAGTFSFTVTGKSGSLSSSIVLSLTVTPPPSYSVAVSPGSLSLQQGTSVTSTITVTKLYGFSGVVSLSASGLPAGVTASIASTTLTIAATASAAPGNLVVTVTGASGVLTQKATVNVTVTAAATFTLSAAPASLTLPPGSSGAETITVTKVNGFTGTVALSASGLPAGVTGTFAGIVLTLKAASTAATGTSTITITGTSGSQTKTTTVALTVPSAPDFSLSLAPPNLTILQGTQGVTVAGLTPLSGFTGTVCFTASGLPSGVTAAFSGSLGTFTVSSTAAAQTAAVTITGTSGSLSHKVTLNLTILAPATGIIPVNLTGLNNLSGTAIDGVPFTGGGLDGGGRSYSGLLLGASQTVGGVNFAFAALNTPSALYAKTVPLTTQFSTVKILATAVNGNQPSQTFTVTYSDGSKSTFTQSLSDWHTPQNYAGESAAIATPYRDDSTGVTEQGPFRLYEYGFTVNSAKTVSSIALPNNRNVVVLAMTLTGAISKNVKH